MFRIRKDSKVKLVNYFGEILKVPKHIRWIATDFDGECHGFLDKPIMCKNFFQPSDAEWFDAGYSVYIGIFKWSGNWKDSLQEADVWSPNN